MFASSFGALLVIVAVCVGVGMPLLAVHFQQREVHERELAAEIDHHRDVVADYEATVDTYRAVTQLEPEDIGAPLESALR
jgi:Na+/H+ antiporter NhaB